jgi:glycosyltransferase involved in cell wall biosynthesis
VRIALLADEEPGWGGIGTYTGVLGTALGELGHDVHLVLRGWEQDDREARGALTIHHVTVPEPSWRRGTVALASRLFTVRESLIFSARAMRRLARIAPDVVEAPEFHAAGLFPALRARLGARSPAVIARLHAPSFMTARLAADRADLDLRAGEALEATSVRSARVITAPSRALAELVARRWHLRAGRVRVVPNPIDEGLFAAAPLEAERPDSILIVGRIERAKGHDLLVEALPDIRRAVPGARLLVVGADGGAREQLERRAAELKVADAITWAGARSRDELPSVYRSASVCVVPSRFEAFPYTALEAMACGRAVLASRVGGLAEVIDDGHDGVLVEPESPAALAAGIQRLLLGEQERRRLGSAARERVLSSYAARKVAARMVDLYAEGLR